MLGENLTPDERDRIQMHFLRVWLVRRCRPVGRRKGDQALPALVHRLSSSQINRYCRWAAARASREAAGEDADAWPGQSMRD